MQNELPFWGLLVLAIVMQIANWALHRGHTKMHDEHIDYMQKRLERWERILHEENDDAS